MGIEIERKFLVKNSDWKSGAEGTRYRQGYLSTDPERTLRVRIAGDQAWLTVKGISQGITRLEFEYELPLAEAEEMLEKLCLHPIIEKTRYRILFSGHIWEIDEFHGALEDLVMAEVELESEAEEIKLPPWIGREVSGDPRYFNSKLVRLGRPPELTEKMPKADEPSAP